MEEIKKGVVEFDVLSRRIFFQFNWLIFVSVSHTEIISMTKVGDENSEIRPKFDEISYK